jgi:hypothetical protein
MNEAKRGRIVLANHGSSKTDAANPDTSFMDAPIDAPSLPVFRNPVALPDDHSA